MIVIKTSDIINLKSDSSKLPLPLLKKFLICLFNIFIINCETLVGIFDPKIYIRYKKP